MICVKTSGDAPFVLVRALVDPPCSALFDVGGEPVEFPTPEDAFQFLRSFDDEYVKAYNWEILSKAETEE
jgi:hypothetical protein